MASKLIVPIAIIVVAVVALAVLGSTMGRQYAPGAASSTASYSYTTTAGYGGYPSQASTTATTTTQPSGQGSGGRNITIGYYSFSPSQLNAVTITASPANLSQILRVSKFRSCAGHDFSGYDFNGTQESARSMKHYFDIPQSEVGRAHLVEMFAPFNGTLIYDNKTLDYPNGDQIAVQSEADPLMAVEMFHIDLLPGIAVGTKVGSGQLIGYKNASEYSGFDVAYGPLNPNYPCGGRCQTPMAGVWGSIFSYMAPQVLAQYSAASVNQSDAIVPESYRNANPCHYPNETRYGSSGVNQSAWSNPMNWANVT